VNINPIHQKTKRGSNPNTSDRIKKMLGPTVPTHKHPQALPSTQHDQAADRITHIGQMIPYPNIVRSEVTKAGPVKRNQNQQTEGK